LNSVNTSKVFGAIVLTPEAMRPVGYKWVFVRKHEKNKIVRYKARPVAQEFSQIPEIDMKKCIFQ